MIRKLRLSDIHDSVLVIKHAAKVLFQNGIDQWDDKYPAEADVQADVDAGNAYGFFIGERLAAFITLNQFNDEEYREVDFSCRHETALTVHRLAVSPDFQNKGIAGRMLDFTENFALENGYESVRLDAFSLNPKALSIYEKHGYNKVGKVRFRKGIFYVFEKRVQKADRFT